MPKGEAWGVVFFALGPEIGAYEPYPKLASALGAAGLATVVLHPRGAGFSDGVRGDIEDYDLFLADFEVGLQRAHLQFPGKALFLFGHSAGAALALHVAVHSKVPLAGLILVNPAYKLVYGEGMGPTLSDYVTFTFNMLFRRSAITVDLNRNPMAVKNDADREEGLRMRGDKLVVRYFSMRYLLAQRSVMDACANNAASVTAPLLLIQGRHDALVDPRGNDEILAACRATDTTKLEAPDGGHGSTAVETVVHELVEWLLGHR